MSEDPGLKSASAYRFDCCELRPEERLLLVDGGHVKLSGRAFDMLIALIERRDRVVNKRELMDIVWPKLVVEENNLQVHISALRKLLGPQAIATVPGRGYRFTSAVETVGAVRPDSTAMAPAPAKAEPMLPRRTNIPVHLPPMYGRAEDVAVVRALVREHELVSIVGAGGIGKTRVAQALAADMAGEFADGAWMVDLASLAIPDLVASAAARALGIALADERAANEVVASVLRTQCLLLVLDNCEHLIDGVVALVDELQRVAPDVRLLITSQEPLRLVDEQVYRLATLTAPPTTADDVREYSAVELFVALAKAADPRFALTRRNANAVADICRRLDGIPLALQLAAARVPLLGIEGLRARLDERFHVLTGGARAVLRRHQTLRGTLEWSHALLTADEQAVFRHLGVFAGTFTLQAAQRVAANATVSPWEVLEQLAGLVDKSLVVAEGEGEPRYRLLETTRAFALERLGETSETDEYLRRHAVATLEEITSPLTDLWRSTPTAMPALAAEVDNVRAAIAWSETNRDEWPLAVELHAAAHVVWYAAALRAEGYAHCLRARALLDASVPARSEARFWLTLAKLGVFSAHAESFAAAKRAAQMFRKQGERSLTYDALGTYAAIGSRRGVLAEVAAALDEAERIEDPAWPARQRAQLPFGRYMLCMMDGRYAQAGEYAQQQGALYREDGSAVGEQVAILNAAVISLAAGRPEVALAEVRPAIARIEELLPGAADGHIISTEMIALVMLGRLDEALVRGRTAYARLQREGDTVWLLEPLAWSAALQGRHADAARIVGFVDARYAHVGRVRHALARERRANIDALLAQGLREDERISLLAAGAAMNVDEVFALALVAGD